MVAREAITTKLFAASNQLSAPAAKMGGTECASARHTQNRVKMLMRLPNDVYIAAYAETRIASHL